MIKQILSYCILAYAASLLMLVMYLSHLSVNGESFSIESLNDDLTSNTHLKALDTDDTQTAESKKEKEDTRNIAKSSRPQKHNSFSYDTREPETYQSRPIPEFSTFKTVQQKKQAFIAFFSIIIKEQNTLQLKRREQLNALKALQHSNTALGKIERKVLRELTSIYRIPEDLSGEQILHELDVRINIIPGSMVLAQAATESAWGTSRFAKQAKNFFGQWCFTKGCGIVPAKRAESATHEIAKFQSAESSVRAYFKNLNTYRTYKEFRAIRLSLNKGNKPLKGLKLVDGLKHYSERGEEYIKELRSIIRFNKFDTIFNE